MKSMSDKVTLDSNILIYAFADHDDFRKSIAKEIISKCNIISLQAVNETACVLLRKFNFPKEQLEQVIQFLKEQFIISSLTVNTLDQTITLSKKYNFSFWDGMMIAAALENHCSIIYTEDLNHNQLIEDRLRIINPFIQKNIKI
ncbi:MAG TPA: DNA-binding protein [Prolixibacteraceae bacterium]|jgi:predicted nucleic acid-binding protein|nr:DNA-binding protein [Prolixibacteraceae bacterium]